MAIRVHKITGENKKLDAIITESEKKKLIIKDYLEKNKSFDGIEEATGIKFVHPVKFPNA